MKAIFIKLGGSLITDKTTPKSAKYATIKSVARELSNIRKNSPDHVLFIGNGAGSYGHYAVQETGWKKHKNNPKSIAEIRRITCQLNAMVLDALMEENIPAVSFPPAAFALHKAGGTSLMAEPLLHFVSLGATPLVHGDIIFDNQSGSSVLSTEEILEALAKEWVQHGNTIESFVYCTSVDGVLDKNEQTIAILSGDTLVNSITKTKGFDVTGGMAQKIKSGFRALEFSEYVYIINGENPGNLTMAINHQDVGTRLVS
jgi:isopentenyl phosphate kinase